MISQVELRAVSAVGLVYITRMLGLFMILPVLALNGDQYIGASTTTIGLALGVYGLMQALLQVPFGKLSDRIGRKPVILMGLALFAAGSILAALSESIQMLIFARAVQGAGAVSAALLALLSECSREQNRSKLMAILGISIGLSFGLAMVLGPVLAAKWGMQSIFWLCVALAAVGALAITGLTPSLSSSQGTTDEPESKIQLSAGKANRAELWRLNLGIFVLHAVQMSMWIAVPVILVENFDIAQNQHWKWYLLAVGGGFVCMAPFMQAFAKRNWYRSTILAGIASLLVAQLLLSISDGFALFIIGLLVFFWGFNLLEATLPSLVSRWVEDKNRGSAMGWYSSSQFFGTFVGGSAGGILVSQYGLPAVFYFGFGLFLVWFAVATKMRSLPNIKSFVLKGLNAEATENLAKAIGIISIKTFQDQQEVFVKVDLDLVENHTLETYQLK